MNVFSRLTDVIPMPTLPACSDKSEEPEKMLRR